MIFQPRHIKCIQIPQNGTTGLAETYRTYFVTNIETVKCTHNRMGGGTFELVLKYNNRNVLLFKQIETIPTFIAMSCSVLYPWDSESPLTTPHPMPMMVETYFETHDLETDTHTITVSGRGVLDVALSNKVIMPKLIYQSPDNAPEEECGFYPWDIVVDAFGRNINGELTPKTGVVTVLPEDNQYLEPDGVDTDPRFVSNISLLHDIVSIATDPKIERTFDYTSLSEVISNVLTAYNLYISGQIHVDATGHLHFDYVMHRLTDLTINTAAPLVYDYGAMPPKTYNSLISTEKNRVIVYVKVPALTGEEEGNVFTISKGSESQNTTYKGWFCKEVYLDSSSLPFNTEDTTEAKYQLMLKYAAADELYKEDNMLIKVEDAEYLFTPMDYYINCWPGCKYTSIGPDDALTTLVITSFVLTGSKQDGWIITPEIIHDIAPGWKIN